MTPIDEIKARLDLVSYIGRTVSLKKAGRTYKACCPFHNESTPSFVVDPDKGTWRCYGACATGGDLFGFVMKRNGWSFAEALRELAREAGIELKPQTPEQKNQNERLDRLRGLMTEAVAFYHARLLADDPAAVAVRAYVRDRRDLTEQTITAFSIGYAPDDWTTLTDHLRHLGYTDDDLIAVGVARRSENGRVYDAFRNRMLIPIRDERGQAVGFGGRALDPDEKAKYINTSQTVLFDKSHILFGLDKAAAAIRRTETAVIVEGYMDAITAHQAGYTNVVAQMGTALTERQLKLIAPKWAKQIVLALDSDAAGQNATLRSLEIARTSLQADFAGRLSVEIRVLSIPDAKDPDDLIREQPALWEQLVAQAMPVADYVIGVEVAALPPNPSVQQREAVARRLLPMLLASENDLYKKDNLQKLALRLHIPERDLLAWASDQIRIAAAAPPRRPPADRTATPPPRSAPAQPAPSHSSPPGQPSPGEPPPISADDRPDEVGYADDSDLYDDVLPVRPLPGVLTDTIEISQSAAHTPDRHFHEEYMLRVLYLEPQYFYDIGRRFYELAGGDGDLVTGVLGDLCADDFVGDHHRIFIAIFRDALEQVEMDASDYIRQQLGDALTDTLEALLNDEGDYTRDRVSRERMSADFDDMWRTHTTRGSFSTLDKRAAAIQDALKLRHRRLVRELEDQRFIAAEAGNVFAGRAVVGTAAASPSADDVAQSAAIPVRAHRIACVLRARHIIEAELHRMARGGR